MSRGERIGSTLRSCLRLAGFIAVLLMVVCACLLRQARAAVDEALLGVGAGLMAYPDSKEEVLRGLQLNGATFYFRTQIVEAPTPEVLDHYEASCDGEDTLFGPLARISVRESARGYVACLDLDSEVSHLGALVSRFVIFSRTGLLREIGQGRYAYVQPVPGFEDSRSFLLTMSTAARFNFYDILPWEGRDAAGSDPADVPRPPNSQRILSSSETGSASTVTVYLASASSPSALARFYHAAFRARGWEILERYAGERLQINSSRLVAADRGDETITVLTHQGSPGRTVVTILTVGQS